MAEVIASIFLKPIFQKLADEAVKKVGRVKGIRAELKSLEKTLSLIQALLVDASNKEINEVLVQNWLNDLKHFAYDIDDVLDDLVTDAMDPEFVKNSGASTSKVRKLISSCYGNISLCTRTYHRLDKINLQLQDLENEKIRIGLMGGSQVINNRSKDRNRDLETSVLDTYSIVGRQGDKDALVLKLLTDEPSNSKNFSIVPIVGMGGVGKTTLAKLLYNDKQVNSQFEHKAWLCVSDPWDTIQLSRSIFQSIGGEDKNFQSFNLLQEALTNKLRGKQFLLVLDDVWTENHKDWETLVRPFSECARGSKVIVTTRKDELLKKLGFSQVNQLHCLSHDDAVSVFCQHALDANNFDLYPTLKAHGEDIAGKCKGLPLALIALGRLLRVKERDEERWKEMVDSEIWSLKEGGIIPALKLSYHELPASLKQLFAYCSLFPKDYLFDKDDLVLLWMAEGFLHQSDPSKLTVERFGLDCFDDLLSRSFFQHSPNDMSLYVMHDLMNDLATSVAKDFFFRLEKDMEKIRKRTWDKFRHISFIFEEYGDYKNFGGIKGPKGLRTFLSLGGNDRWLSKYLLNKVLVDILPQLQFLRVLSLSGYEISELPDSIGKLKHLRYLNLSRTKITHFPENVCDLYNLETLILFGCSFLTKFPKNFRKLKSLRHLDTRDTPLLEDSPLGIGEMKIVQTLSKIIIGGENEFSIAQLKDFENLRGTISIKGLDKVLNATEAREACLSQKKFNELELEWCDVSYASRNVTIEKEVLDALKRNNKCLKRLGIVNYLGLEFSNWVGDPSFDKLARVSIHGCKKCTSLPPLGQLKSLKELAIQDMGDVKVVGSEFLGTDLVFPSLEVLSFEGMQGWEVWSTNRAITSGVVVKDAVFPCLKQLRITNCPNLVNVSPGILPRLKHLETSSCGGGVLRSLVHAGPSVTKLIIVSISGLTDAVWRDVLLDLKAVEELDIRRCDEIRYLWESKEALVSSKMLVNLRKLELHNCNSMVSLGEKDEEEYNNGSNLLTSLSWLGIQSCESLKHLSCPNNIEVLQIMWSHSVTCVSFSTGGGQKLKSVTVHMCENVLLKEELEGGGNYRLLLINSKSMPMLEYVWIHDYPNLASLIEFGGNFMHLNTMSIEDCKSAAEPLLKDLELPRLTLLTNLEINNCPSMDAPGVWPPNLSRLYIGGLKKPISEWGTQKFPPSLSNLIIKGEKVTSWSPFKLPSSLTQLHIENFHNLETVSEGLRHLTSLQHLTISDCPKMKDLPETLLPKLLSLKIWGCPALKKRYKEGGSYWRQISHIPTLVINT